MSIQNDLLTKGYSIQKMPDWKYLMNFQKAWEKFVQLPLHEKKKLPYVNGVGYEFKGKKKTFDEKDNFHFSLNDVNRLLNFTPDLVMKSKLRVTNFIDAGMSAFISIHRFMFDILLPELKPLVLKECYLDTEFTKSCRDWVQRSLYYHSHQESLVSIADAHPDKGFITLAYFSSETGLEILDITTGEWKEIIIPTGHTLIMCGLQGQFLTQGRVKALYHRVSNSEGAIENGRFAQVVFCDINGFPKYNKIKHKSTQLKPVGFNYYCSHSQFLKEYL